MKEESDLIPFREPIRTKRSKVSRKRHFHTLIKTCSWLDYLPTITSDGRLCYFSYDDKSKYNKKKLNNFSDLLREYERDKNDIGEWIEIIIPVTEELIADTSVALNKLKEFSRLIGSMTDKPDDWFRERYKSLERARVVFNLLKSGVLDLLKKNYDELTPEQRYNIITFLDAEGYCLYQYPDSPLYWMLSEYNNIKKDLLRIVNSSSSDSYLRILSAMIFNKYKYDIIYNGNNKYLVNKLINIVNNVNNDINYNIVVIMINHGVPDNIIELMMQWYNSTDRFSEYFIRIFLYIQKHDIGEKYTSVLNSLLVYGFYKGHHDLGTRRIYINDHTLVYTDIDNNYHLLLTLLARYYEYDEIKNHLDHIRDIITPADCPIRTFIEILKYEIFLSIQYTSSSQLSCVLTFIREIKMFAHFQNAEQYNITEYFLFRIMYNNAINWSLYSFIKGKLYNSKTELADLALHKPRHLEPITKYIYGNLRYDLGGCDKLLPVVILIYKNIQEVHHAEELCNMLVTSQFKKRIVNVAYLNSIRAIITSTRNNWFIRPNVKSTLKIFIRVYGDINKDSIKWLDHVYRYNHHNPDEFIIGITKRLRGLLEYKKEIILTGVLLEQCNPDKYKVIVKYLSERNISPAFMKSIYAVAELLNDRNKIDKMTNIIMKDDRWITLVLYLGNYLKLFHTDIANDVIILFNDNYIVNDTDWMKLLKDEYPGISTVINEIVYLKNILGGDPELPDSLLKLYRQEEVYREQYKILRNKYESTDSSDKKQSYERIMHRLRDKMEDADSVQKHRKKNILKALPKLLSEYRYKYVRHIYNKVYDKILSQYNIHYEEIDAIKSKIADDLINAIIIHNEIKVNNRLAEKIIKRFVKGDHSWYLRIPENKRFLSMVKKVGIDVDNWVRGYRKDHEDIVIYIEDNPIKVLQMGNYFDTCLSQGKMNVYSTITNAVEINKRVIYAKNKKGHIVGRKLIAMTDRGNIVGFRSYGSSGRYTNEMMRVVFENFCVEFVILCNARLVNKGEPSLLIAQKWYNDGIEEFPVITLSLLKKYLQSNNIERRIKAINKIYALWGTQYYTEAIEMVVSTKYDIDHKPIREEILKLYITFADDNILNHIVQNIDIYENDLPVAFYLRVVQSDYKDKDIFRSRALRKVMIQINSNNWKAQKGAMRDYAILLREPYFMDKCEEVMDALLASVHENNQKKMRNFILGIFSSHPNGELLNHISNNIHLYKPLKQRFYKAIEKLDVEVFMPFYIRHASDIYIKCTILDNGNNPRFPRVFKYLMNAYNNIHDIPFDVSVIFNSMSINIVRSVYVGTEYMNNISEMISQILSSDSYNNILLKDHNNEVLQEIIVDALQRILNESPVDDDIIVRALECVTYNNDRSLIMYAERMRMQENKSIKRAAIRYLLSIGETDYILPIKNELQLVLRNIPVTICSIAELDRYLWDKGIMLNTLYEISDYDFIEVFLNSISPMVIPSAIKNILLRNRNHKVRFKSIMCIYERIKSLEKENIINIFDELLYFYITQHDTNLWFLIRKISRLIVEYSRVELLMYREKVNSSLQHLNIDRLIKELA